MTEVSITDTNVKIVSVSNTNFFAFDTMLFATRIKVLAEPVIVRWRNWVSADAIGELQVLLDLLRRWEKFPFWPVDLRFIIALDVEFNRNLILPHRQKVGSRSPDGSEIRQRAVVRDTEKQIGIRDPRWRQAKTMRACATPGCSHHCREWSRRRPVPGTCRLFPG
jgi:hypothetical protein